MGILLDLGFKVWTLDEWVTFGFNFILYLLGPIMKMVLIFCLNQCYKFFNVYFNHIQRCFIDLIILKNLSLTYWNRTMLSLIGLYFQVWQVATQNIGKVTSTRSRIPLCVACGTSWWCKIRDKGVTPKG